MIPRILPILLIFSAAWGAEDDKIVIFEIDSIPIALSFGDSERIGKMVETIVETANFNSRDHKLPWFEGVQTPRTPQDIKAQSFFKIDYPAIKDIKTVGGTIKAKEIWIIITDARYPGPIYLSDGQNVIALSKYSGVHLLGLGLDPAVFPHLPADMQKTMKAGEKAYRDLIERNNVEQDAAANP